MAADPAPGGRAPKKKNIYEFQCLAPSEAIIARFGVYKAIIVCLKVPRPGG